MVVFLVQSGAEYSHIITKENKKEDTMTSVWQLCEENEDKECAALLGGKWTPKNHKQHPKCVREAIVR